MYEFMAPWGVLGPAVTALITYVVISNLRWREEREKLDRPNKIGEGNSSGPETARIVV
ncbi:MAG: hypothetical protein AAFY06_02330 [Pseudomonadota bacterium]